MTSLTKNLQPPTKKFIRVLVRRLADQFEHLNSSLAQSADEPEAMALVRQLKTTGFRYDIFVELTFKVLEIVIEASVI